MSPHPPICSGRPDPRSGRCAIPIICAAVLTGTTARARRTSSPESIHIWLAFSDATVMRQTASPTAIPLRDICIRTLKWETNLSALSAWTLQGALSPVSAQCLSWVGSARGYHRHDPRPRTRSRRGRIPHGTFAANNRLCNPSTPASRHAYRTPELVGEGIAQAGYPTRTAGGSSCGALPPDWIPTPIPGLRMCTVPVLMEWLNRKLAFYVDFAASLSSRYVYCH